jgi:hypothetical protein
MFDIYYFWWIIAVKHIQSVELKYILVRRDSETKMIQEWYKDDTSIPTAWEVARKIKA